jgi:hypothetical protein
MILNDRKEKKYISGQCYKFFTAVSYVNYKCKLLMILAPSALFRKYFMDDIKFKGILS